MLYAVEAERDDAEAVAFWSRTIEKRDQRDGDLEAALERLSRTGALERSSAAALAYGEEARTALKTLPAGDLRDALSGVAAFVVSRLH